MDCHLLVNQDEQITVYEQIAEKLGLTEKYGKVVSKPTSFINNHTEDNPIDVAFIDEAHLLLTQGKQSYQGQNQLQDIIKTSRVTVVMFDENQILTDYSCAGKPRVRQDGNLLSGTRKPPVCEFTRVSFYLSHILHALIYPCLDQCF